jgi:hypothetical protein
MAKEQKTWVKKDDSLVTSGDSGTGNVRAVNKKKIKEY